MNYLAILTGVTFVFGFCHFANSQTDATSVAAFASQVQGGHDEATQTKRIQKPMVPIVKAKGTATKIGFRLKAWKTIHADSADGVQETIATLKKIGCEVESDNHGNHIDIRYRCLNWKSMRLATDQLVDQWTTWCAAKGMETIVMNPPVVTQKPTVKFRLPAERTVHLHNEVQATQILTTLKLIGCIVSSNQHGDHTDATFACPEWITIQLPSDDNAHAWQSWLNESGFETQHSR